jgi:hypothetical protein
MNNDNFQKTAEQMAAFQKMWGDSMSKIMQGAFSSQPNSPPPEVLRQIRSGILQALAQSWDEFMRSPQFLEGMKQWMDNAVTFRKASNDFMAKVRNDLQAPSRDDIDSIMLTVRHMEKRLLDRLEDLGQQVSALNGRAAKGTGQAPSRAGAAKPKQPANARKRSPAKPKGTP